MLLYGTHKDLQTCLGIVLQTARGCRMVAKACILKPETFKPAEATKEQRRLGWQKLGAAGIHLMAGCRCTALQSDVNVLLEILMPLTSRCLLSKGGRNLAEVSKDLSKTLHRSSAEGQLEEATTLLRIRTTRSLMVSAISLEAKAPRASQRWWPSPSDLSTALLRQKKAYNGCPVSFSVYPEPAIFG